MKPGAKGHPAFVNQLAAAPDAAILLTADGMNFTSRYWDLEKALVERAPRFASRFLPSGTNTLPLTGAWAEPFEPICAGLRMRPAWGVGRHGR